MKESVEHFKVKKGGDYMLKVRLEGLPEEVQKGIESLEKQHQVLSVSKPYPNRNSEYVRCYIEMKLKEK